MRNTKFFFFLLPYTSAASPPPPLLPYSSCLWPHGTPSPPCEGDRGWTGQISPCGPPSSTLLFILFSFCTVLAGTSRASTPNLRSGHVQVSFCCLPEAWGGTLFRLSPFFLKTSLVTSSTWRDLQWLWMFSWQWVWGLLPFQAFLGYLLGDLRVDLTQLFFMKSPNRIAWHLMPWTI